ncbi:MAG: DUF2378 family protein, partial [Myxococcaceae bacterium]|nr:DUF2378 family protein [Myxococcaceae bacterium]
MPGGGSRVSEPVMFGQSVEALFFRAFTGELPRTCRERLRRVGIDLERPLLPAYPIDVWLAALDIAAEELLPELSRESAYREIGRRVVKAYTSTLLGRAGLLLNGVLGPRRMLERMSQTLRLSNNFMEARLRHLGPTDVELWVNTRVRVPSY